MIKIHKLIEKWSKRKVELISPQLKKETPAADNKVAVKEIKEVLSFPVASNLLVYIYIYINSSLKNGLFMS